MTDRLSGGAARDSVAATDLDRLTGKPDNPISQIRIHLGPHETVHAAERTADHEAQMRNLEPLGDQPVHAVDHVVITVMRKITFEPIGGLLDPPRPSASGMMMK